MKVSQLIEALQAMPQDADIVTHANNHTASRGDTMKVALQTDGAVIFGNWHDNAARGEVISGDVYSVSNYGDRKGQLTVCWFVRIPAHRRRRDEFIDVPETWELQPK